MGHTALKKCHIYFFGTYKDDWTPDRIKAWVKEAGGIASTSLTDQTTHAIVPEKPWRAKSKPVQEILNCREQGQNIHILQYDWLEKSLSKKVRLSEGKFSWDRADKQHGQRGKANGAAHLMSQVLINSTSAYVDPHEKKRIDKQCEQDEKDRKKQEEMTKEEEENERRAFEKERDGLRVKKIAAVFRRGAQKARNELLSDNHHIFMDSTGFTFDVLLTKVDTKRNTNERWAITLQLYESNSETLTYAVNCQFSGTGKHPQNNIVAAMGSTFETAFRAFKKIFKEKTRIDWNDRITAAVERSKMKKHAGGQETDSRPGSHGVVPEALDDFNCAPYLYQPPLYGPKGAFVMSGANGPATEFVQPDMQVDTSDEDFDMDRFMPETGDFTMQVPEGVTDDALEDPFNFGKPEEFATPVEPIGSRDQNTEQEPEEDPIQQCEDGAAMNHRPAIDQSQSFNHTQIAEQARDDFVGFAQNDSMLGEVPGPEHDMDTSPERSIAGMSRPEKRKYPASEMPAEDSLMSKKSRSGETNVDAPEDFAD